MKNLRHKPSLIIRLLPKMNKIESGSINNMIPLLFVALGGAIGSSLRYGVSLIVTQALPESIWPFATFLVNITGCFLIGLAFGWFSINALENQNLRLFLATGILGGFTTFSAFSLELYQLAYKGEVSLAVLYGVSSVILSILALVLAIFLTKAVLQ